MAVFLSLWGSRALSWALGPGLKIIAITFAALIAIIWFRASISSGIKARFEAAQATEIARAVRVEAARLRAIEYELEQAREHDRRKAERAVLRAAAQEHRIAALSRRAEKSGTCQLPVNLRKALNQ
jgi:hypothetical protein